MSNTPAPVEGNVNKGPELIAATAVVAGTSTIFCILRFAVNFFLTRKVWWDDWTIVFAVIGNVIGVGLDFVEIHYGFGRPQHYLTKWQLIEFMKYTYGEWIQTFATLMWTKISICLFLLRIPVSKTLIRPLQASIVFLVVSNVVLTIMWICQCRPIDAAWNTNIDGICFTRGQLQRIIISQAIISAVSDFAFATYPIVLLWKVQLKMRTKIALCCLMGVSVFTGVCCIVRTVLNFQAIATDPTYGGIANWFWRLFEVNLGIMAACTPVLRPGYQWLIAKIKGRSLSSKYPSSKYPSSSKWAIYKAGAYQSSKGIYPSSKGSYPSSKGHTQLSDEVTLRPLESAIPSYSAEAYTAKTAGGGGFDPVKDMDDMDMEMGSPVPNAKVKKTVQLDQY